MGYYKATVGFIQILADLEASSARTCNRSQARAVHERRKRMKSVKILGLLVLIVGVFAIGYWRGQSNTAVDHSPASSSQQSSEMKSESGAMEGTTCRQAASTSALKSSSLSASAPQWRKSDPW